MDFVVGLPFLSKEYSHLNGSGSLFKAFAFRHVTISVYGLQTGRGFHFNFYKHHGFLHTIISDRDPIS